MTAAPSCSLVIVNYRTPLPTKLCLRSLRKHGTGDAETLVVDNRSGDASTEYLRGLSWIRLFENDHPSPDHQNGLDLAIHHARGAIIAILHTDTFVRRAGWLRDLLSAMEGGTMLAGSTDRVILPFRGLARLNLWWKRRKNRRIWARRGLAPKILSACALYRRELFTEHGQKFDHPSHAGGFFVDCGEPIQRYCEERGLPIRFLRCEELCGLLWHFEGATLNAVRDRRLPAKRRRRIAAFYRRPEVRAILDDESLDR